MNLQRKAITISVSLCLLLVLTATLLFFVRLELKQINQEWIQFNKVEVVKSQAITDISRNFGFGGFIHHFKNLLIRSDSRYLQLSKQSLDKTYLSIDRYLSVTEDKEERQYLLDFKSVVNQYAYNLELLKTENDLLLNLDLASLDNMLKIEDTPAIEAMSELNHTVVNRFKNVEKNTTSLVAKGLDTFLTGGWLLLFFWLLVLITIFSVLASILKKDKFIQQLFKFSPDAILVVDKSGNIIEANKKAIQVFRYSEKQLLALKIKNLIPKSVRNKHKSFQFDLGGKNQQNISSNRSVPLRAVDQMGREFPVDTSVFEHDFGSEGLLSIIRLRDISEQEKLKMDSVTDHLTQLPNRRSIEEKMLQMIEYYMKFKIEFVVMLLDIDHFKNINDSLGHQKGDEVLQMIAKGLKTCMEPSDFVGRFGGEEFMVISKKKSRAQALILAELIRTSLTQKINGSEIVLTVSIGVASFHLGDGIQSLIERADRALYQSKKNGRNKVSYQAIETKKQFNFTKR